MNNINHKILFVSPHFMGYELAIKKALTTKGYDVDFYDDRPSNSFWSKAIIRVRKELYITRINNYYEKIWKEIAEHKYSIFFVLNVEAMPIWFLKRMKEKKGDAKFIYYAWDSLANRKNSINYLKFFDKIFSFDKNDCDENPNIIFRPLFFIEEYSKLKQRSNFKYDFCFIGTAHSDRFPLLNSMRKQISQFGLTSFWYLYLQTRKLYLWCKLTNPNFKNAKINDFEYTPMTQENILKHIEDSRIIIDIQHPKQTGLTMRTIEALGARRKLITTNSNIKNYDFYRPENIYVIDRQKPKIDINFMKTDYIELDSKIYQKYSISGWINDILN